MDTLIEGTLIAIITHPLQSLAIAVILLAGFSASKRVIERLKWVYQRDRFFKQLEMKFYGKE